jgi:hypothetical protein
LLTAFRRIVRFLRTRLAIIFLWSVFILVIAVKVRPNLLAFAFGPSEINGEYYRNSTDIVFNILLAVISFLAGAVGAKRLFGIPRQISWEIPEHIVRHHSKYADPCKSLIV